MKRILFAMIILCWASPSFAQLGMIPDAACAGNVTTIAAGQTDTWTSRTSDVVAVRGTLILQGQLSVSTLCVYEGGFLDVQSGGITIRNTAPIDTDSFSTGILVAGRLRMLGQEKTPFVRLAGDALAGQTTLTLVSVPTNWAVGDEVFIGDSRQIPESEWYAAAAVMRHEFRTIAAISGTSVTLNVMLTYDHRGARDVDGSPSILPSGLRAAPHLVNLTRSIVVKSEAPNGTRGHVLMTGRAQVEIRNVGVFDMGRTQAAPLSSGAGGTNQIGRYPLHFHHLLGPMNPTNTGYQFIASGNAIVRSRKWPIAVHNSSYGLIERNVVVDATGGGIVAENGQEMENLFRGNFVADVRGTINPRLSGPSEANGDTPGSAGECYWAGGFYNRWVNNVAVGCRDTWQEIISGNGFKFITQPAPTVVQVPVARGSTVTQAVTPQYLPVLEFSGNECYGVSSNCVTLWSLGTDGYSWNTAQAQSAFLNTVCWHLYQACAWNYPAVNLLYDGTYHRVDWNVTPIPTTFNAGYDYRVVNKTVRNSDVQSAGLLDAMARDPLGAHRFENNRIVSSGYAFNFNTPDTNGTGADRPSTGVTFYLVNNTISPRPGQPLRTINMFHTLDRGGDPNDPYIVNVTEGTANYRVCFPIQATENLYGGTCPNSTTRADINGIIVGAAPQPPPQEVCGDGIDNDGDGQIDEGCPAPPQPCSGVTSPDGTRGVTITDAAKCVWSLGGPAPAGGLQTLREGVWMAQGGAVEYLWQGGQVYVRNNFTPPQWYRWDGSSWLDVADPTAPVPPADADGDGVPDSTDKCPGTAAGATVDANGCSAAQRDTDSDGVNDALDKCPGTPAGTTVDAAGCAIPPPSTFSVTVKNGACWPLVRSDSNGDGIEDNNTPDGAGGWSWQPFMDGAAWGKRVTSAPYQRQAQVATGTHSFAATWTKTGRPTVTTPAKTFVCPQF